MDVDLEPLSSQDNVEDCMMTGVEENVNCTWDCGGSSRGNDQEPCADLRVDNLPQTIVDVFATSLRSMKEKCSEPKEDEQKLKKNKNKIKKKKKKKGETADKK
ncbi:hypothetical protein AHAS_Ahas11G0083700 [Arachis hypogaea]